MSTARQVGLRVEADPDLWLPGPVQEAPERWLAEAVPLMVEAFDLETGSPEAEYVATVLTEFSGAELDCDLRYLLWRAVDEVFLVVRLDLFDADSGDGEDPLAASRRESGQELLRQPVPETVDATTGLRRIVTMTSGETATGTVRYHRRDTALATDVVVSCGQVELRALLTNLPELDLFARGVRLSAAEEVAP